MNMAELTSYIVLIIAPICAYFGFSEALSSALAGAVAGIVMLYIAIKNEQNPSDILSKPEPAEQEEEEFDE